MSSSLSLKETEIIDPQKATRSTVIKEGFLGGAGTESPHALEMFHVAGEKWLQMCSLIEFFFSIHQH